jgi:TonB family protein
VQWRCYANDLSCIAAMTLYIATKKAFDMFLRKKQIFATTALVLSVSATLINGAYSQTAKLPIVPPVAVKLVKPDCGDGESCHGIHGVVVVGVYVFADGTVDDPTVDDNSDPRLVDAALKAAKRCRFQPGTLNGKPTRMHVDLKFHF